MSDFFAYVFTSELIARRKVLGLCINKVVVSTERREEPPVSRNTHVTLNRLSAFGQCRPVRRVGSASDLHTCIWPLRHLVPRSFLLSTLEPRRSLPLIPDLCRGGFSRSVLVVWVSFRAQAFSPSCTDSGTSGRLSVLPLSTLCPASTTSSLNLWTSNKAEQRRYHSRTSRQDQKIKQKKKQCAESEV